MKVKVDKGAVANLTRSLSIVPQMYSVIVDPVTKDVISGVHRRETGKALKDYVLPDGYIEGLAKKLGITRDMMVVVLRQHLNVQRQPSKEETQEQLLDIARGFEDMGVPKQQIARKVVEVSGLSEHRTLALLPEEYKHKEKVVAGRVGGQTSALAQEQKRVKTEQKVEGISQHGVKHPAERNGKVCPECGGGLRFYECGFLHCSNSRCRDASAYEVEEEGHEGDRLGGEG